MKKFLLISLFIFPSLNCFAAGVVTAAAVAFAEAPKQRAPLSAEELYNNGNYKEAALAYEAQLRNAHVLDNPFLFYNLGNSYFKAGETDKAVLNYYRAYRILPRDKDIRENLAFALSASGQRLVPEGVPPAAFYLFNFFSVNELEGLLWICVWIFAICYVLFLLTRRKRFVKRFVIGLLILTIIFTVWYLTRLNIQSNRMAIISVHMAEVRSGPGVNFPVSATVPTTHIVFIKDTKGDYAQIQVPYDSEINGWVLKEAIEEI